MTGLAALGEISKGAWGNRYQSYGQDDQRNYHSGKVVGGVGAGTLIGSGIYGAHGLHQATTDPETKAIATPAVRNLNRNNDLQQFKAEMRGTKYAPKLKRARTGAKVGAGLLVAAPVAAGADYLRRRANIFRNGQSNF